MKSGKSLSQKLKLLISSSLVVIFIIACDSSANNDITKSASLQEKVRKSVSVSSEISSTQNEVNSQFRKFVREAQLKIKANEIAILRLKQKTLLQDSSSYEVIAKKFYLLEKANKELNQSLETYVRDGEGNWNNFRTELYKNLDKLELACEDVYKTENRTRIK